MFTENLDVFFNIDEHADQFVIQKNGEVFRGVIDEDYVETLDTASYQPVITCKTKDVEQLERGDIIEHGKKLYKYIYEQKDRTGVSELILNYVSG